MPKNRRKMAGIKIDTGLNFMMTDNDDTVLVLVVETIIRLYRVVVHHPKIIHHRCFDHVDEAAITNTNGHVTIENHLEIVTINMNGTHESKTIE